MKVEENREKRASLVLGVMVEIILIIPFLGASLGLGFLLFKWIANL